MTHLTTRLAARALFAVVMQTEVHAQTWTVLPVCRTVSCGIAPPDFKVPDSANATMWCTQIGTVVTCQYADQPTCAPGYEQACQQRDHGTDGLRRSEQR
jgi:hypothetical protein